MVIARVKPIMQVRYTKGRQLCYKDHIVNLPQDITEVARRLPRLPEELDMVIIRRDSTDLTHHIDCTWEIPLQILPMQATLTTRLDVPHCTNACMLRKTCCIHHCS
jgi:hypothetical protein